jgi:hypothetical protein
VTDVETSGKSPVVRADLQDALLVDAKSSIEYGPKSESFGQIFLQTICLNDQLGGKWTYSCKRLLKHPKMLTERKKIDYQLKFSTLVN